MARVLTCHISLSPFNTFFLFPFSFFLCPIFTLQNIYMKITNLKKIAPVFAAALLSLAANAQKKIELKFNPDNGSKYAMQTKTNSVITQMGMDINLNMQMDMDASITPQNPNKLMTMQYSNIAIDMDMMGQKVNLSSNGTDAKSASLKKLTQKSFGCVLDPNGKIVQVVGLDSLIAALGAGNPAANYFNDDAIKSTISQTFSIYPNHPIAIGETWSNSLEISSNVKMKANVTCTLEKVENSLAYIKINSTLDTDGQQKVTINGMDVNMSMKGTQNGEMIVDAKTGMYTTSNLTQDLTGNIMAMGQEIPMAVKSTIASTSTKQ